MDRLTWQALTEGNVELPRRRIHAGLWFRMLRTLLDELNTPLSQCGIYATNIRYAWEYCGHPLRAGQTSWRPYEILDQAVQLQMLEAAAAAIHLIKSEILSPPGEFAELFSPEPQTGFTNGLPANEAERKPISRWEEVIKALNEALAEARYKPETARSLFALASYGQRDIESLESLRAIFVHEGIPEEFLSNNDPNESFA